MTDHNTAAQAAMQDFVTTELRGIIDVCGDSPTAIVSVERMRLWLSKLRAPVADEREALAWYAEQVEGCRKLGSIGDPYRHALDSDGGKRARAVLASAPVADRQRLRELVDVAWNEATASTEVPSTPWADRLIDRVFPSSVASAPVADESPMTKMADALREKARQEQQAYQDRRNQATEWGPMPEGTEADRPISIAPVAHVAGDETSRYLEWEKDRSAWEMPVGTPVYYAALASAPVAGEAQRLFAIPAQHSGVVLSMVGATLHIQRDGSGQIVVAEDDFTLEDDRSEGPDGPQGSVHWVARLPASELTALRHFLNGYARPSDDALWDRTLTERDEYHDMADKLANAIADHLLVEIGEHSSSNCPWMRALDAIQNAAPQASEAARDALVPFAALEDADLIGTAFEGKGDDAEILHFHRTGKSVTLGDFRRARAALSAQPGAQKEQSDAN